MRRFSAFRVTSIVNLFAMLTQALFAGVIVSGGQSGQKLHLATAKFLVLTGLLQVLLALAMKVKAFVPRWLLPSTIGVLLAEIVEFGLGTTGHLLFHVPLAVAIFGGATRQWLWAAQNRATAQTGETR